MPQVIPGRRRVPFVRRCELRAGEDRREGLLCNISPLGAYVSLDSIPQVGAVVELSFGVPQNELPVVVEAQVTWDNPYQDNPLHGLPPGCGLRFLSLTATDKKRIDRLIDEYVSPIR